MIAAAVVNLVVFLDLEQNYKVLVKLVPWQEMQFQLGRKLQYFEENLGNKLKVRHK